MVNTGTLTWKDSNTALSVKIFYAYQPRDQRLYQRLRLQLAPFEQSGAFHSWTHDMILAGSNHLQESMDALNTADLILFLLSPDFLASDYPYGPEFKRALERHYNGEACFIPILLRPTYIDGFRDLWCLPSNGIPVTNWTNHDDAFLDISRNLRHEAERLTFYKQTRVLSQRTQTAADILVPLTIVASVATVVQTILMVAQMWASKSEKTPNGDKQNSEHPGEIKQGNRVKEVLVLMSNGTRVSFHPETSQQGELEKFIQVFNQPDASPHPVFISFYLENGSQYQQVISQDPTVDSVQLSNILSLLKW